jgi:predicted site-specific integrase-resolvase
MSVKLDIVGITEIADDLGVAAGTVRQWHRRGVLPPPDAVVAHGAVWHRSTIKRWAKGPGKQRVLLLQQL